ncbi:MAG: CorA family divalent cation transporter [Candidatus Berkiellales bacterium]
MITNFSVDSDHFLVKSVLSSSQIFWSDVFDPTQEERSQIEEENNIILPLHHEMHQIEFSNRYYEDNGALYLSLNVVTKAAPFPESHVVVFVLADKKLITLRYSDPNPIKNFTDQLDIHPHPVKNHYDIFLLLLRSIVGNVADMFELIGVETDMLAQEIVQTINLKNGSQKGKDLNKSLRSINNLEHLLAKSHQSLSGLLMLVGYFQQIENKQILEGLQGRLDNLKIDINALLKNGEYLNQKLGFQLQSTLGQINIEQTQIIKIFTVIAMVFMPPTLIASIYGMNFHNMPELTLPFAYPIALIVMLGSALLPYRFFKKKGWI